jgi:hypothetical protein
MSREISEADWKRFRKLRAIALERFCDRILSEVDKIKSDARKSAHERYLAIFALMRRRDDELGNAFDDFRRSTAVLQLATMNSLGLVTPEDLYEFSPDTQETIARLAEL